MQPKSAHPIPSHPIPSSHARPVPSPAPPHHLMALPNLRHIFASSRTSDEERQLSRTTFYKFAAFVGSCVVISLLASRGAATAAGHHR
ncbi:hypothetical protein NliqN6_2491 [Naganishia liquefaciens]|uniref:Uncharacterized protein n=1 Tax=Naganishia liquefaciens TaxID=104408 RepID=A0A8H3TTU2_9TREE|nr:hypothetical protein NliqN6_2491 [Naganishia liquefaciens]